MTSPDESPTKRKALVRAVKVILPALVLLGSLAVAVALASTSSPDFFARYKRFDRRYVNLEQSRHEGIGCRVCHETDAITNGIQLTGDYYSSLLGTRPLPKYYRFSAPTNEACLKCHRDDWTHKASSIPHPAHNRVSDEQRPCVDCHKWTAHLEAYTEKHEKMPFSGLCITYGCHAGVKQSDECVDCHHTVSEAKGTWTNQHRSLVLRQGQNSCLESCHEVTQCQSCHTKGETPQFAKVNVKVDAQVELLHAKPEWINSHGEQASKDQKRCLLCHYSQGECAECHRERPKSHGDSTAWIGRHKNYAKSVKDSGCLTCHKASWCGECHDQFKEMK